MIFYDRILGWIVFGDGYLYQTRDGMLGCFCHMLYHFVNFDIFALPQNTLKKNILKVCKM